VSLPARVPHPANRLETLARVIHVVSSIPRVDTVLEILMDHLIELVGAERGFIMLVDPASGALEFRTARNFARENLYEDGFQVSRSIVFEAFRSRQPVLTSDAQADERFRDAPSIHQFGVRAVMCAPVLYHGRCTGVLYVDNRMRLGAFEQEDLLFLQAFAHQAGAALEQARLAEERNRTRELFTRYVSPEVVEQILARPDQALCAERRRVTVMFCDVRGFSGMAERLPPEELLAVLNGYFEQMTECVFAHRGTLLSYIGDGLLVVFGAPLAASDSEARALRCARDMARTAAAIPMPIAIGIATGEAVVGDLGTPRRREYTVLGDAVNVAARLEKLTKKFDVSILCDEETWRAAGLEGGRALGVELLPGKSRPVPVWAA
jgi:adenylate cyclase